MTKHMDEARSGAIESLKSLLNERPSIERAVLIDDIFGVVKVVFWAPTNNTDEYSRLISQRMGEVAGPFWSNEIWAAGGASDTDSLVYNRAWSEGYPINSKLRLADRVRNRTAWFRPI